LYVGLVVAAYAALLGTVTSRGGPWWALLGLLSVPLATKPARAVMTRTDGPALNGALAGTGALLGVFSLLVSLGLLLAS
jgi:1,4-dihydroxy-2-naphthoate octaprenyltransferase